MKWKLLPILLTLSMIVQMIVTPIAQAQQYGYGYPQQACPYPVEPANAISGEDARLTAKKEEMISVNADLRAANRELRTLESKVNEYEEQISDVVQPSMFERIKTHMTNGYDCCEVLEIKLADSSYQYFKKLQRQDFAISYPVAFEDSTEMAIPVSNDLISNRSMIASNQVTAHSRMPAADSSQTADQSDTTVPPVKTKPKAKAKATKQATAVRNGPSQCEKDPDGHCIKPSPQDPAPPVGEKKVTDTQPTAPPQAPADPVQTIQTQTCPVTPCPNQAQTPGSTDFCRLNKVNQEACREILEFQGSPSGLSGGPNTTHCDDPRYRTPKFLHVCGSGGQILPNVCQEAAYRKGNVDKNEISKCTKALAKYAKAIKAQNKQERLVADLESQVDSLKEEYAALKKEKVEALAEEKELEAVCPDCLAARKQKSRASVSSGPSGLQMGLVAAAAGLGGLVAYKGAQAANRQNIETGWPAAPYLAAGSIYPFVQAGISGIMGGVSGAYGCGATVAGGGYAQGPGGVGPYGPYGPGGPYGGGGGPLGYPPGYGYPPGAGGVFNPGIGPWGQPGFGGNGGINGGIGIGGPGGFNPYMNPYANPYGNPLANLGGGINAGLYGGIGSPYNPYGSPFGSPYGGVNGGAYGGIPGLGGIGGYGGLTGGLGGGLGGTLSPGNLQLQQLQAQQYQQNLQYQIQQQQTALQKYQTEQALLQDYSRITNQLRLLESGGGYGGTNFGAGIDFGISAGLGFTNSIGGVTTSFPTTTTGRGR